MGSAERDGLTAIICTHNGSPRLGPTLRHLAEQADPGCPWSVILVDNASTDGTAAMATHSWPRSDVALRVVNEPELGLSFARAQGLRHAGEIAIFVDDDNWLDREYLATAWQIMNGDESIAVLGGEAIAVFEADPPSWFHSFQGYFATGSQDQAPTQGAVWGAGMVLRVASWRELLASGWQPLLTDRRGDEATSAGDIEICLALRRKGFTIAYDPRLRLQHFMPAARLTWDRARALARASGQASVQLDRYRKPTSRFSRALGALRSTAATSLRLVGVRDREGNGLVLRRDKQLSRLRALVRT